MIVTQEFETGIDHDLYYDETNSIFYLTRKTSISLKMLLSCISNLSSVVNNPKLNLICDLRLGESDYSNDDIKTIHQNIKESMWKFSQLRLALVVDTPRETALCFMLEAHLQKEQNCFVSVFSSIEAAQFWHKINSYS